MNSELPSAIANFDNIENIDKLDKYFWQVLKSRLFPKRMMVVSVGVLAACFYHSWLDVVQCLLRLNVSLFIFTVKCLSPCQSGRDRDSRRSSFY